MKFGEEKLVLSSWNAKLCYDVFCHTLAAGMNAHLKVTSPYILINRADVLPSKFLE